MSDAEFSKMINNYFQNDYRERGKVKWPQRIMNL